MRDRGLPKLWLIVPCYNEEQVLPITSEIFKEKLEYLKKEKKINRDSYILFVNDGSKDETWKIIVGLSKLDNIFRGISQSRNFGHQSAVLAGLMEAKDKCDITITVDCDGQDDIEAIDKMVEAYSVLGCEIVYGVRDNRDTDTFFKRISAEAFYKFLNILGAEVVYNHADYRLMSRKVLEKLSDFTEVNIFLRGIVPLVGFKSTNVYYKRQERIAGKSKYPFSKMMALAIDGITSLSIKPIRAVTCLGLLIALISFIGVIWSIIVASQGKAVSGWASTICIICFVGGIQLLALGVIGEYIGKIYMETKKRPRFIISEKISQDELEDNMYDSQEENISRD